MCTKAKRKVLHKTNFGSLVCHLHFIGSNKFSRRELEEEVSEGIDYISCPPDAIMLSIISLLPIKDMMVVSVLSRLWRSTVLNQLSTVPSSLNLDEFQAVQDFLKQHVWSLQRADFYLLHSSGYIRDLINSAKIQFKQYVNRTRFLHTGCTINYLHISCSYDSSPMYTRILARWVHFALANKIKELDMDFSRAEVAGHLGFAEPYELPNWMFSPVMLRTLTLTYCKLRRGSFGIVGTLKTLYLRLVTIRDFSLGELTSRCPVLEDVTLEKCDFPNEFMANEQNIMIKRVSLINCETEAWHMFGTWPMFGINISAPNLLMLKVVGVYLQESSIRNAVQLRDDIIDIKQQYADHVQGDALGSILDGLGHCKTLTLSSWCIQLQFSNLISIVLPTGEDLLERLPNLLLDLKHLKLVLGFGKQVFPGIACLLRSCPNLEILTLKVQPSFNVDWDEFQEDIPNILDFEEFSYWELQEFPFYCMEKSLKKVKISGFTKTSNEIQLIKFILDNAEVLKKMEIFLAEPNANPSNATEQHDNALWYEDNTHYVLTFPRVAPKAHVAVYEKLGPNM